MRAAALIVCTLAVSACDNCPVYGEDMRGDWDREARAVCSQVPGCDLSYVLSVPVYEAPAASIPELCDRPQEDVVGCFCHGPTCSGAIVIPDQDVRIRGCYADTGNCIRTQREIALHEYVHAAFHSVNVSTSDHGPDFQNARARALQALR